MIGGVGLPAIALPIASGIILQQLTQGFMAWIVIHLLAVAGIKPLEIIVLGFFAGPVGWAIAGAGILTSIGFAASKFNDKKKEILFLETIFSIYSCRYQNRLQAREW
ncbi:hypothetical protein H6F86_23810 [Phormidium sp. FACHB-592]|uniref:Uncharacterized protein n=1 Tax=Stenomitos frigidus AS-A4 TaxID=2933935 RepID=A0ABV0KUR7_9CYAN|nr:hypothetical protein [Phormidium sp. FACHB-592]MBD2076856.1 hypothetical protein [Phormidium sp. FACHB-592]